MKHERTHRSLDNVTKWALRDEWELQRVETFAYHLGQFEDLFHADANGLHDRLGDTEFDMASRWPTQF